MEKKKFKLALLKEARDFLKELPQAVNKKIFYKKQNPNNMKKVGNLELYSFEEVKDDIIGEVGSPERDEYEREVTETLQAYEKEESEKRHRYDKPQVNASFISK
ncbi:MAG: hypothetical protein LUD48_03345 [Prevotella sp.]|nr:hypothetical protein [Prevotella sp.]